MRHWSRNLRPLSNVNTHTQVVSCFHFNQDGAAVRVPSRLMILRSLAATQSLARFSLLWKHTSTNIRSTWLRALRRMTTVGRLEMKSL